MIDNAGVQPEFQSPIGEVIVEALGYEPKQAFEFKFQSPIGEVVGEANLRLRAVS